MKPPRSRLAAGEARGYWAGTHEPMDERSPPRGGKELHGIALWLLKTGRLLGWVLLILGSAIVLGLAYLAFKPASGVKFGVVGVAVLLPAIGALFVCLPEETLLSIFGYHPADPGRRGGSRRR